MVSVFLIGLSLSMDAFAVSVGSGISIRGLKHFHMVRACFFFGIFQFLMPVAGWYLGSAFAVYISALDHWAAFVLLTVIGGKMILGALRPGKNTAPETENGRSAFRQGGDIRSLFCLLTLSAATSIDALAVGLSFSILGREIWGPAAAIGCITFVVCMLGFEFGRRIGVLLEKWAEIAGGAVLIVIGLKILLEHLLGS
jgi:putative Mn2+ efflux pump MntP